MLHVCYHVRRLSDSFGPFFRELLPELKTHYYCNTFSIIKNVGFFYFTLLLSHADEFATSNDEAH